MKKTVSRTDKDDFDLALDYLHQLDALDGLAQQIRGYFNVSFYNIRKNTGASGNIDIRVRISVYALGFKLDLGYFTTGRRFMRIGSRARGKFLSLEKLHQFLTTEEFQLVRDVEKHMAIVRAQARSLINDFHELCEVNADLTEFFGRRRFSRTR